MRKQTEIDLDRVRSIVDEYRHLDGRQSYYLQWGCRYERLDRLVPSTREVLRRAFDPSMRVLDVGCGRGDTLIDCASCFERGTGLDESDDVMLAAARRAKDARGIENVDFVVGKAIDLPFDDGAFDVVFSERGPLGHSDGTLREALRVLRSGGFIFVETGAALPGQEVHRAFKPDSTGHGTVLSTLEHERERFERHGVSLRTLASRIETLRFADFYEWLKHHCCSWNGPDLKAMSSEEIDEQRGAFERLLAIAADEAGRISIRNHTIWIAGLKA